jgi:hypothetical protein
MDRLDRALFLACAFGMTVALAHSYPIQSDEGYTLNAAWQLWTGQKMYDDFRLFVGPGSGYAVELVWRVVGSPSFLAARLLSLALAFGGTTGVYLLLWRLGVRRVALAVGVTIWAAAGSLYVLLNHNSFSSYAATWFLLALVRLVQARAAGQDRPRDALLVGIAAGVSFLFLPMKGGLLVCSAVAFLFATRRRDGWARPAVMVAAGFAAVIAPLFAVWSPLALLRQWVIIPLTGNYLGHTGATWKFAAATVVVVAVMGWVAVGRRDRVLQVLAWVQAALFMAMTHNMEPSHLAINAFPAIVFAVLLLHEQVSRSSDGGQLPATPVMAAFLVMELVGTAIGPGGDRVLQADLLGRRHPPMIPDKIARAHAIYAGPFLPSAYYLLRKKNPFFVSETVVCNDDCQQRLIAQLQQVRPELALLDYEMIASLKYPQSAPVDTYLRAHYAACPTVRDLPEGIQVRAIDPAWCP